MYMYTHIVCTHESMCGVCLCLQLALTREQELENRLASMQEVLNTARQLATESMIVSTYQSAKGRASQALHTLALHVYIVCVCVCACMYVNEKKHSEQSILVSIGAFPVHL